MKILVTGATGFIGFEVSRKLCKMGYRPRLIVRRPYRGALLASLDAEILQADITSVKSLGRALDGIDTVIHLAARATFEDYRILRPTIVDGSISLMKAAKDAGVKTFVFSSSMLVYDNQEKPIDSKTLPSPKIGYGKAKLEAEIALSEIAKESGINFASIRLPHIYGPQDLLFGQIRNGLAILPGDGKNNFAHLHIEDCARILISIAQKEWTGISPVGDYHSACWNEFFSVVKDYYPRFRLIKIPRWLAYTGIYLMKPIQSIRSRPTIFSKDTIKSFTLNLPVKSDVLWNELGITPKYRTIFQGIPAVLDDFVAFRWRHPLLDQDN